MPVIELITEIEAPLSVVFDASRDVDIHVKSMSPTNETILAGTKSGCMGIDDWVTWRAKHLGRYWNLTALITEFEPPVYFKDEMVQGPFKRMEHEHHFREEGGKTIMKDVFLFEAPMGWIGKLVSKLMLEKHLTRILESRNAIIRQVCEK